MQQINRLINLDTLELSCMYRHWTTFLYMICIYMFALYNLFVFKDDYFNETRLSEIKCFRFDKFVRSPALYFWCNFPLLLYIHVPVPVLLYYIMKC